MTTSPLSSFEIAEQLEKTNWAFELDWAEVLELSQYLKAHHFPKGNFLFKEGHKDRSMAILVQGQMAVIKNHGTAKEHKLALINPPQTIGELSLIDGEPRSATALFEKDSMVLKFDYLQLKELEQANPALAYKLLWRLTRSISQRLRATSSHLSRAMDLLH